MSTRSRRRYDLRSERDADDPRTWVSLLVIAASVLLFALAALSREQANRAAT